MMIGVTGMDVGGDHREKALVENDFFNKFEGKTICWN
jgi:hypothetical protein